MNDSLYGAKTGPWAEASARFVDATVGEVRTLTGGANAERVFGQTEIPHALNNPNITSIDGIPLSDLKKLGETDAFKAISAASDAYTTQIKVLTNPDGSIYKDGNGQTRVDSRGYFEATGLEGKAPTVETGGYKNLSEYMPNRLSQHADGASLLQEIKASYVEQLRLAEGSAARALAVKALDKLGWAGDILALGLIIQEANAAYAAGDKAAGDKVVKDWAIDFAGGLAGGLLASQLMGSALAPLYLTGPAGAIVAGGLTLLAGLVGGIFGSIGLGALIGNNEALISELQKQFNAAQVTTSPLTLDLNGDGVVETTALSKSISTGTHFNLDAQGLSENTGWVSADDGLLVRDLNSDGQITSGRELFGNHTLLSNGQEASNGFEALQALDSNADGVINAADQAFASLQVWKDADGDGVTDAGELLSLEQAGVSSLNVSYTTGSTTDAQGNQHLQLGSYTTTSGASRNMGDVRSLQQTMARDTTGQLQALVQQWKSGTMEQRESVLDSLIYQWAGVQDVDPNSRGDFIGDARRLAVLEAMLGQTYVQYGGNIYGENSSNPGNVAADDLNAMYKHLRTTISDQLFLGSDGQGLLEQLRLRWVDADPNAVEGSVDASAHFSWDTSSVATTLNEQFAQKNVQEGVGTVVDFFRALNTFQLTEILQSLKAQATNYSGTYALLLQQADVFASNIGVGLGTDDQLRAGSAGGVLFGLAGNDVLESADGQDILVGGAGNDILFAGYGSDILDGGDGDDILDGGYSDADTVRGGAGNDSIDAGGDLEGGVGNDTIYLRVTSAKNIVHFNVGDGQDTLHTGGAGAGRQDTLSLGQGIHPSDIQLMRSGNDMVFKLNANDQVTVADWFLHYSYQIDQLQFFDGTTWTLADINNKPLLTYGTAGKDTLTGLDGVDMLYGLAGNDTLNGGAGNDTLDGGSGTDKLLGGTGNDVYVFGRGYGVDTITDADSTSGNTDIAKFQSGVAANQLWFRHVGNNLEVSIIGTTDKLTVQNWYSGAANQVEQFTTVDNKTLLNSQVENLVSAMAAFAPPSTGQTTLPQNYQDSLSSVIAANWK
jgi:hypothetical protein